MRKLSEINTDEFLDCVVEISPIIPFLLGLDAVQAQFLGTFTESIQKQQSIIRQHTFLLEQANEKQKEEHQRAIDEAVKAIQSESNLIYTQDFAKLVPFLASRENRKCVTGVLAILSNATAEDVAKYPPQKFLFLVKSLITDTDFKSFFIWSEESEATAS